MKAIPMHPVPIPADNPRYYRDYPTDQAAQILAVLPGYAQLPVDVIDEDILLIQDRLPLHPTRRLVVLVPPGEIDETALARRVWQLANSSHFNVLYLALSPDITQTAYQRRRLASLAALTSGQNINAHTLVIEDKNWRQALDQTLQHGDLLVCLASHRIFKNLFWRRKLGEQLVETAGVPVYMFGGFKILAGQHERQVVQEALAWIISLPLLAVFFGIQVSIDRSTDGPYSTILLFLSVVVEIYLLWKINELIG